MYAGQEDAFVHLTYPVEFVDFEVRELQVVVELYVLLDSKTEQLELIVEEVWIPF